MDKIDIFVIRVDQFHFFEKFWKHDVSSAFGNLNSPNVN